MRGLRPAAVPAVQLNVSASPAVTLQNVCMQREERIILDDVSLRINAGDFVAVTGPNGGGKTTLLRIILGLLKPSSGKVSVNVQQGTVGYLPQKNAIDAHFPISVTDVVASGLLNVHNISTAERSRRVAETVAAVELTEHAARPIGRLSGGQVQRALLGRAIISRPKLLVLDEPLSYIDKHFEQSIYRLIASIAPHCTTILVSHEMSTIASMANRHLLVDRRVTECHAAHHYIRTECDE